MQNTNFLHGLFFSANAWCSEQNNPRPTLKGAPKDIKILLDGKVNYLKGFPNAETVINGDDKFNEISAASIVAKVARDNFMAQQDVIYLNYNFVNNVGYGTKVHMQAIQKHGLTPLHRWSYKPIKQFLDNYELS